MREAASKQVQYSLKRLQCTHLFNTTHYDTLVDLLTGLGESVGCAGITPPWLSLYLDGDTQNYHSDASHGPLAYVYSLTLDEDYGTFFTGGETMLLDPSVLEYWRGYDGSKGVEAPNLVKYIPPTLGRVVAFDPRIPHGVTPVRGTRDVRHGRVVIHGWFTQPEIQFRGELNTNEIWREDARLVVEAAMDPIIETLGGDIGRTLGYLAIQLDIVDGSVTDVTAVADTLVADPEDFRGVIGVDGDGRDVYEDACSDVRLTVREYLGGLVFSEGMEGSIVIPFSFT